MKKSWLGILFLLSCSFDTQAMFSSQLGRSAKVLTSFRRCFVAKQNSNVVTGQNTTGCTKEVPQNVANLHQCARDFVVKACANDDHKRIVVRCFNLTDADIDYILNNQPNKLK